MSAAKLKLLNIFSRSSASSEFNIDKEISFLHPTNMTQMVKIFSASVFGATLPNPTDVNDVNVK
jgi:hypothetical protein